MTRGSRIAQTLAVTLVCLGGSPTVQRTIAQSAPAPSLGDYDVISADVTIKRSFSRRDSAGALETPEMRYRWEQVRKGSRWKTTFSVASIARRPVETLDGPVQLQEGSKVARIEDEGDGSPLRVFDHNGQRIYAPRLGNASVLGDIQPNSYNLPPRPQLPFSGTPTRSADSNGLEMFIFARDRQAVRREALEERLGRSVGRIDGKDQYVNHQRDTIVEVLADPDWELPVESNVLRDGELVLHTTFSYEARDTSAAVVRAIRTERRIQSGPFERAVTEVLFTNIRSERGR
jgi:hypothetical protein